MQTMPVNASINAVSGSPAPVSNVQPAAVLPKTPQEPAAPDQSQIMQAMETANASLRAISADLEFSLDPSTGKTVVRVIDNSTKQVIRQFPSEEMLAIAHAIDRFKGVLLSHEA